MAAMILAVIAYVPLLMFCMYYLDMGITGLGLAASIKDFIMLTIVTIHGYCSKEISSA